MGVPYPFNETLPTPLSSPPDRPRFTPHTPPPLAPQKKGGYCPPLLTPFKSQAPLRGLGL
jgi:hypothetical protein